MIRFVVRQIAEARGLKNAIELASYADISRKTAYRLWNEWPKHGEDDRGPGVFTLARVATALNVSVFDLIVEEPDHGPLTVAATGHAPTVRGISDMCGMA
jgi:hypothetical protein